MKLWVSFLENSPKVSFSIMCVSLGWYGGGSLKTEGFNGVKTEKLPDVLQGLPDLLGFLRERVGLVFAEDALQVLLRRVAQLAATG